MKRILMFLYRHKFISFESLPLRIQTEVHLNNFKPKFYITHSLIEERKRLKEKIYVIT